MSAMDDVHPDELDPIQGSPDRIVEDEDSKDFENEFLDLMKTGVTEYSKAQAEVQPHEIGATSEIKVVYAAGSTYCSCCKVWNDEKPNDDSDAHLKELAEKQRERFAILKRLDRHGRGTWRSHSIVINSKPLRERFETLFADYLSVDPHDMKPTFSPPFLPFIHRWERLERVLEAEQDEITRKHLTLLVKMLSPETEESFKTLKNVEQTGFAPFENLNLIFVEGETVLHKMGGVWSAGVLREVALHKGQTGSYYTFTVDVVDWNGEVFGVLSERWMLTEYKGSLALSKLNVLPLRSHSDPAWIRKELTARGRKFESLNGYHFKMYSGKAIFHEKSIDPYLPPIKSWIPINERVIVDADSYQNLQGDVIRELRPLAELKIQQKSATHMPPVDVGLSGTRIDGQTRDLSTILFQAEKVENGDTSPVTNVVEPLTDEQCFLAVAWVKGFAIHTKLWCEFGVSEIRDIQWNDSALENLVLGESEKRLLRGIVSSQKDQKRTGFDDFVQGKGKGVIILLSGPPGVGKTLTAECMAESLRRPLYRLGAADLGSSVTTLEIKLSEALVRCAEWDAVLLLDEADVFLEARTTDSLQRNEMISIFLRLLEYYAGVLLLTTNRPHTIDPAFESRIDIALNYANLTAESRAKVLQRFLQTLPDGSVEVSQDEVADLMKKPLNGRQIKSAVKTARILAQSEGLKLQKAHLDIVLGLRAKAKESIERMSG